MKLGREVYAKQPGPTSLSCPPWPSDHGGCGFLDYPPATASIARCRATLCLDL